MRLRIISLQSIISFKLRHIVLRKIRLQLARNGHNSKCASTDVLKKGESMLDPARQQSSQVTKLPYAHKKEDVRRRQNSQIAGNYEVVKSDFQLDGVTLIIKNQEQKKYRVILLQDSTRKKEYTIQEERQNPTKISVSELRQMKLPKLKPRKNVIIKSLTPEPNGEDLVKYLDILHRSESAKLKRISMLLSQGYDQDAIKKKLDQK